MDGPYDNILICGTYYDLHDTKVGGMVVQQVVLHPHSLRVPSLIQSLDYCLSGVSHAHEAAVYLCSENI